MSVGFIGAGQVAQALVRGFAAAGEFRVKPGILVGAVEARRFQPSRRLTVLVALFPPFQGVVATHKITASAPDRDLPTVQGLRVCTASPPSPTNDGMRGIICHFLGETLLLSPVYATFSLF